LAVRASQDGGRDHFATLMACKEPIPTDHRADAHGRIRRWGRVVSFHVFSKLERRTRHATAGCLVSVQAGGQTRGQTARTAGALGQGHASTPGRLPGYGCGRGRGGAHALALAIIAAVAAVLASAGLRYCTAARHGEAWEGCTAAAGQGCESSCRPRPSTPATGIGRKVPTSTYAVSLSVR
jgi:hypothetical protein